MTPPLACAWVPSPCERCGSCQRHWRCNRHGGRCQHLTATSAAVDVVAAGAGAGDAAAVGAVSVDAVCAAVVAAASVAAVVPWPGWRWAVAQDHLQRQSSSMKQFLHHLFITCSKGGASMAVYASTPAMAPFCVGCARGCSNQGAGFSSGTPAPPPRGVIFMAADFQESVGSRTDIMAYALYTRSMHFSARPGMRAGP